MLRRFGLGLVTFLSITIGLVAAAPWVAGLTGNLPSSPLIDHLLHRFATVRVVFLAHVVGGAMALATGPWQLMGRLRARRPGLHRATGYVYVSSVAMAGAAGLLMSVTAWGGPVARVGFFSLATAWLATTALGLSRIRSGDRAAHQVWITRSFALSFAAVSLRLQSMIFGELAVPDAIAYPIVAWSSWVPNLVLVELLRGRESRGLQQVESAA